MVREDFLRFVTRALPPIAAARMPTSSHGRLAGTLDVGNGTGVEVGMLVGVLVGVLVGALVGV